jgi:hypothetical protein
LQEKIQPFQSFPSSLPGVEGAPFASARNTARGAPTKVSNKVKFNCPKGNSTKKQGLKQETETTKFDALAIKCGVFCRRHRDRAEQD